MPGRHEVRGFAYRVDQTCPRTAARTGLLSTAHGDVRTPAFMPVGTRGTVKGVQPRDLRAVGSEMLLGNTYHLHLRPGEDVVRELGGLARFMGWDGPTLTDSGGYQVFSLGHIARIDDGGVVFQSVVDGSPVHFTPERVMDVQRALGADVAMAFDQCPSDPNDRAGVELGTRRTHDWLTRCVRRWEETGGPEAGQALFGIAQGGAFADLRAASVEEVLRHDLPGYAIGGVCVGEDRADMLRAIEAAAPLLPPDRPRYLMGIGTPVDFVDAIMRGVDLFDCVTPTRHGRNHQIYTSLGRVNLRNAKWKSSELPLDPDATCPLLEGFTRGYLRHLCVTNEMLAGVLLTMHNLWFFHRLIDRIRAAIPEGTLPELREEIAAIPTRIV